MIDLENISVVVQGAIDKKETLKCLKSIRKFLPEAEIILSTWEGSDVSELAGLYDTLILNKMPDAPVVFRCKHKILYNNMNRQLLSTQEGLKRASRKYAMKFRSDLILTNNDFLQYFDKFQNRIDDYKLFERKILVSALFTRCAFKIGKFDDWTATPFHISDWWFFGLKKDLDIYFADTRLAKEPEFTDYFAFDENRNKKSPYGGITFKFAPEQYFGYECFSRNFGDIHMEDAADYSDELTEKYKKAFVNNFIVLEFEQSGIYLNKYSYSKNEKFLSDQYTGLCNFYRYESEYKRYCDKEYVITAKNKKMFENEKYGHDLLRIYKHIAKLFEPETKFLSKLEQIFIAIPILVISFKLKHYK